MEEVSSSPIERFDDLSSKEKEPTIGTNNSSPVNEVEVVKGDDEVVIVGVNGRKLTSTVWNSFDQIKVNGVVKAKCKGCKNIFVGGGKNGTTHLKDHARRCFKTKNNMDVRQ